MSSRVTDTLSSVATTPYASSEDKAGLPVSSESISFNGYQTCDDYEPSYTDDISLDEDDQLSAWFKDLQENCNYQSDEIRVFLSFIEHKHHVHGNHTEKSKLAQVRTAFSNLLAELMKLKSFYQTMHIFIFNYHGKMICMAIRKQMVYVSIDHFANYLICIIVIWIKNRDTIHN